MNMVKAKETLPLFWIDFKVNCYWLWEQLMVVYFYYRKWSFMWADISMLATYLFRNPFQISKKYLQSKGETNIYNYGETPLTTLDTIAKKCGINPKDTVFELGCGRGRTCLWLSYFLGCNTVGIEMIPEFVKLAHKYKKVEFRLQDMLEADLTGATVVYLYGTTLEDEFIRMLALKLSALPGGTAIITISYDLNSYTSNKPFELIKRFPVSFPWGQADVYLQYCK